MTTDVRADVAIVGSGMMGSIVAHLLRAADPHVELAIVDGGPPIGDVPGRHLHDIDDAAITARYAEQVDSGIQGLYVGAEVNEAPAAGLAALEPGMFHASSLGQEAAAMPAMALAWNVGGMGVHWTAATPWPSGAECFPFGDRPQWDADLDLARRVLRVAQPAIGPTRPGELVLDVLRRRFAGVSAPGRAPQPMPMAIVPTPGGRARRTSPAVIFPPLAEPAAGVTVLARSLATELLLGADRVEGVAVTDLATGHRRRVLADAVVVCADAVRTPQLLFASGLRHPALGRFLNEHAFVTARVLMDLDRFGLALGDLPHANDGEFATDSLWVPHNDDLQPYHGQVMNSVFRDGHGQPLAYAVGLSLYVSIESRRENRLAFDTRATDIFGMPRARFELSYTDGDRRRIDRAVETVSELAAAFGPFEPASELAVLPPGSSLHMTGTVRCGPDAGDSVCDPDGRVWGVDGLYLAGNGVVPTALACNATLTGAITAIRAARAVARTRRDGASSPRPTGGPT